VTFVPVAVFGKMAGTCAANLVSGQEVNIEGRLQFHKRDIEGKKITVGEVVAHHVDFGMKPRREIPQAAQPPRAGKKKGNAIGVPWRLVDHSTQHAMSNIQSVPFPLVRGAIRPEILQVKIGL